jgi:hypothetical protein
MEYVELRIRIEDTKNTSARWQNSPPARGTIRYGSLQRQTIRVLSRWVAEDKISRREELEVLGSHLYGILFTGEVETQFQLAYHNKGNATLRVVLEFDAAAQNLATLPWEYLYVPDDDERGKGFFIAVEKRLILSRHVPLKGSTDTLKPRGTALRVLVVISQPSHEWAQMDRDGERVTERVPVAIVKADPVVEMLEDLASQSKGRIQISYLRQPTKKTFAGALEREPHIVHFIGHGRYQEDNGALAFIQDGQTDAWWLTDSDFADFFRSITPPRLIFLHACEGARSEAYDAFSGVALKLVYSRMPAVVAMQYPISNLAAIAFARSLYQALSCGRAIDEAVHVGRNELGMYLDEQNFSSRSFGSPIVFLQSKDARSLQGIIESAAEPASVPATATGRVYHCPNPNCGMQVNPTRLYCRNSACRAKLQRCKACGEMFFADALFCDACGADVDTSAPAPSLAAAAAGRPEPFG